MTTMDVEGLIQRLREWAPGLEQHGYKPTATAMRDAASALEAMKEQVEELRAFAAVDAGATLADRLRADHAEAERDRLRVALLDCETALTFACGAAGSSRHWDDWWRKHCNTYNSARAALKEPTP